jgi:septum site-determining protein MinD
MAQIISIHSFRGGTGKSHTAANVATVLAAEGRRVGHSLNDYLWGNCEVEKTAYDVTDGLGLGHNARVFLVPSSVRAADIARVMREGYDVGLLNEGFRQLIKQLALDVLILDTHPGLNEETLLSIAMSNALAIVLRPDHQDYEGTRVTVSVARKLQVPRMVLVVNKTPNVFDSAEVKERVENTYGCEVAAVLPHSDELMVLSSEGIFSLRYPDHPLTASYKQIAERLIS